MEPIRRYGKIYLAAIALFTVLALLAANYSENAVSVSGPGRETAIFLDPGHGGEDGGAVSVTGVYESQINLEVSLRLRDLLRLCGLETAMTREGDYALYDADCTSISQKKSSDLRNRVAMVLDRPDAIVLSIHQNQFPEAKYRGAQVFYNGNPGSKGLAEAIQSAVMRGPDRDNHRKIKPAEGIYLMEKIPNTAALIECGFLSNPEEEALLRTPEYQKRLISAVCAGVLDYLGAQTLL